MFPYSPGNRRFIVSVSLPSTEKERARAEGTGRGRGVQVEPAPTGGAQKHGLAIHGAGARSPSPWI
eukprot:1863878-Pyramimonas_sp.AAC.1